jgi:hypothetical protein
LFIDVSFDWALSAAGCLIEVCGQA